MRKAKKIDFSKHVFFEKKYPEGDGGKYFSLFENNVIDLSLSIQCLARNVTVLWSGDT
jgi:hypothetical protein